MIVISSIDQARRRVLVTASGRITAKDMLAHIKQEQDDGLLSFSELVDARGAQPAFSPAALRVSPAADAEASLPDPSSS